VSDQQQKMHIDDLKGEIESILNPEPEQDGQIQFPPHPRLSSVHGLDISYYRSQSQVGYLSRDGAFERLLQDDSDPLHDTLQSGTVPGSLLHAAFKLFGDSLIEYHERERRSDVYRFYPSILMTVWSAFEAWVRISSEMFVAVVPTLPRSVADALLEVRSFVTRNGQIERQPDRRPVLDRYWLLLKYGCNLEFDRGSRSWQAGKQAAAVRDSLVHYDVLKAPSLTAFEVWDHMEAVMLLFIAPSTLARRTLFPHQFGYHYMLVQLHCILSLPSLKSDHLTKDGPETQQSSIVHLTELMRSNIRRAGKGHSCRIGVPQPNQSFIQQSSRHRIV
jgi:hypothetical protein